MVWTSISSLPSHNVLPQLVILTVRLLTLIFNALLLRLACLNKMSTVADFFRNPLVTWVSFSRCFLHYYIVIQKTFWTNLLVCAQNNHPLQARFVHQFVIRIINLFRFPPRLILLKVTLLPRPSMNLLMESFSTKLWSKCKYLTRL